jgi:GntR family transcriptional regulator/MocR family aminotransferase
MFIKLEGDGPLHQRVYRGLRAAILEGRLGGGARLPSTRSLAAELRVSRNVVLAAFDQLAGEGYVEGRTGSGTYVSLSLPDTALAPWGRTRPRPSASAPPRLSASARRVVALSPLPPPGSPPAQGLLYDFRYGLPSIADFPHDVWARLVGRRARAMSLRTLRYGRARGFWPLREAIADYVTRARGVATTTDQVVVVNGAQQGLDLIARLLLERGDRVVIEEPGYSAARNVLLAAGARLVPVRADRAGLDVARLPRQRSVRLAYVTPSHQFPLGGVLPLERRLALLRWAADTGAYVVEDDYDSEFQYEGQPVEAVQGLDRSGRVIYIGTFSKVLFPSLRIGYVIVPENLAAAMAAHKFVLDYHTATFEQEVLAEFMAEGHFERHLRRCRARNAGRRAAVIDAVANLLGDAAEVQGANAGVHIVVWLRDFPSSRLEELLDRAVARRLGIYPIAPYYMRRPRRAGLLLGYACLSEREIREGIAVLADLLRRLQRRTRHDDSVVASRRL